MPSSLAGKTPLVIEWEALTHGFSEHSCFVICCVEDGTILSKCRDTKITKWRLEAGDTETKKELRGSFLVRWAHGHTSVQLCQHWVAYRDIKLNGRPVPTCANPLACHRGQRRKGAMLRSP